jgi:3-deoxy-manno-octulosonate cytidylyltransferase (CMP-KDO synthetase)
MIDNLIIIPARYQSSRFPGKPLADIHGKSMLRRVWEKCAQVVKPDNIIVATDDERIRSHCLENDMQVEMTSSNCLTGTDRLYEVALKRKSDIYINVQGDEPLVLPEDIKAVINASQKEPKITFNAMCSIKEEEDFRSPNVPKVVTQKDGRLLYMSRAPIPTSKQFGFNSAMKQVCIYAFPYEVLMFIGSLKEKTPLESIEDIEILRFLELGYNVKMVEVSGSSIAVDTPQDLEKVRSILHD